MPATNTDETQQPVTRIEFIQYHQPRLTPGTYQITVQQEIKTNTSETIPASKFPIHPIYWQFTVLGDRFSLNPQDIHAVFPPNGSLGDHSNVLPHILLNRSTLPWERKADAAQNDLPWLALLLFEDTEKPTPHILTLEQLKNRSDSSPKWSGLTLETGQQDSDRITVIDVEQALLAKVLPTQADLAYLAHIRQGTDADGKLVGDELAVVIGNRLPKQAGISTVHLVSVEGRYSNSGFDYQGASDKDLVRLVSLKNWSFACIDPQQRFKKLLLNLDRTPGTLRLPLNQYAAAEDYLKMGYVPLQHYLRQGKKVVSWYHSPLATCANTTEIKLPARAADELVRYNSISGLFNVSYAAAWELGRLLALQSKNFSIRLYNWKRAHAQQLKQTQQQLLHAHLPIQRQLERTTESVALPVEVANWFDRLSLLQGVPFNYLVPDERMLPRESIRFFYLDAQWINCLLDGAFSIGRVTTSDHQQDNGHTISPAKNSHPKVTGLLLRSDIVSGWTGLQIDAYHEIVDDKNTNAERSRLTQLRMDRLSANVLICLFEGEVKTVDIYQKPETLHFGLDVDENSTGFYKRLRNSEGLFLRDSSDQLVKIPLTTEGWKDAVNRVINIEQLANQIQQQLKFSTFTSAQFALEMIEGGEKVRYRVSK